MVPNLLSVSFPPFGWINEEHVKISCLINDKPRRIVVINTYLSKIHNLSIVLAYFPYLHNVIGIARTLLIWPAAVGGILGNYSFAAICVSHALRGVLESRQFWKLLIVFDISMTILNLWSIRKYKQDHPDVNEVL